MADELLLALPRQEKFWRRVAKRGLDDCWYWQGTTSINGYGQFYVSKTKRVRAHRVSWVLANGAPIPTGKIVCHSCDTPSCCNPKHLWVGTDADNNRDRAQKGRSVRPDRDESKVQRPKGEEHWAAKLQQKDADAIRVDLRPLKIISAEYGIDQSTVSKIRLGKIWAPALIARAEASQ